MRTRLLPLLVLALLALPAAATANPLGDLLRISELDAGGDGSAYDAQVAYNGGTSEYLVSWTADGIFSSGEDEVWVQRMSASGAQIGADRQISTIGAPGDTTKEPFGRAPVAADHVNDRQLVAWAADDTTDGKFEIFGQLLNASGQEIGANDFQISLPQNGALYPHVAFNPGTASTGDEEYLVVWVGNTTGTPTVFAQRLDENGALIGSRFAVSQFAVSGTGSQPQVAYNQGANEYLVAWYGGPSGQDRESWGQRLSATGAEIGTDVKLTSTGTDTDDVTGGFPSISYNPLAGNYLMTWTRDEPNPSQVIEIYSQVLSATAVPQGTPRKLSATGIQAYEPAVAYATAPGAGQYLVMWQQEAPPGLFDYDMWGQRVAHDGTLLGARFQLFGADQAFNVGPWVAARTDALEWLAVWSSDCPRGTGIPAQDTEILGRRVDAGSTPTGDPVCRVPGTTPTPTPTATPTATPAPIATAAPTAAPGPPVVPKDPPKLKAADVLTFPSSKQCVSRRKFRIRLRTPKGAKLTKVTVSLNGKLIKTVKGKRITAKVDLRGLPKGRFKVKIQVTTADGRKVTGTRKYRTCAPKKRRG